MDTHDTAGVDGDLGPHPLPAEEAEPAAALRSALEGRRPSPGLLAGVQRRARRRHRRRLAGSAAGTALALTGLVALVPLGVLPLGDGTAQGGEPAQVSAAADAVEAPSGEPPSSPPAVPPSADLRLLTLQQVQAHLPTAATLEEPGPVVRTMQYPPPPPVGGLCVDQPLDGVPAPPVMWVGMWGDGPISEGASENPDTVRQEVLRWDTASGAEAYLAAVAATDVVCMATTWPEGQGYEVRPAPDALGDGALVLTRGLGDGQWHVRVVAGQGATAQSVTAEVTAPDATAATDVATDLAATGLAQAVGKAVDQ